MIIIIGDIIGSNVISSGGGILDSIRNLINISGKTWDDDKNLADAEIWGLMTLLDGANGKHLTIANTADNWSDEIVYQAKVRWPVATSGFSLGIDKATTDFQIRIERTATSFRVSLYYGNGTNTGSHLYDFKLVEDLRIHTLEVGLKKSTGRVIFILDGVTYYDGTQEIVSAGQTTNQARIGSYYNSNYGNAFYISDVKVWKSLGKEDENMLFFIPDPSNAIDVKNQITVTKTGALVYSWHRNGSFYNLEKGYSLWEHATTADIFVGFDYDTETAIAFSQTGYTKMRDYIKGNNSINMFGYVSLNPILSKRNYFDIWNRANTDYWLGLNIYESNNYLWPIAELTPDFWTTNIVKDRDKIDITYVLNTAISSLKQYGPIIINPLNTPDVPSSYFTLDGTTVEKSTDSTGCTSVEGYQTTTGGNFAPQSYYFNGKTYCIWKKRGGLGYSLEVMIFTIDHSTGTISDSYSVAIPYTSATDIHNQPALIVGDDGYIYVVVMKPVSASGGVGRIYIYKSNSPEDITAGFTSVYNNTDYVYQYPHILKNSNGIYVIFNNTTGRTFLIKGTTLGASWTQYTIMDTLSTINWNYILTPIQENGDLHLIINFLYSPNNEDSYPIIYHLYSTNDANCGILWKSLISSFSININTANKICRSDLDDYFTVINDLTTDITKINYAYCGYVYNGSPYFIMIDGGCTTGQATSWINSYKLVYFEPENYRWVFKTINNVFPNIPTTTGWLESTAEDHPWSIIVHNQNIIDMIVTVKNGSIKELRRYRTINKGDTWSLIENIYTSKTSIFNQITHNAPGIDDIIIYGTIINSSTDTNLLIQKLNR